MRRNILLPIAVVAFLVFACIVVFLLSQQQDNNNPNLDVVQTEPVAESPFTIDTRNFLIGTAGFFPRNYPDFNTADLLDFWHQTELAGELFGIHIDWKDTSFVDSAAGAVDTDFVLVLGWQEPSEWESSSRAGDFITTAKGLLGKYRQIKYLGVGNEINSQEQKYPDQFANFKPSYQQIYAAIKKDFPDVKVFPVFQYEMLLGEAYLTGKDDGKGHIELLSEFDDYMDLAAFTSYPFFQYTDPGDLPINYYSQIRSYTDKPIAFTELGWMSREEYSGNLKPVSDMGYTGSEEEQKQFLLEFVQLISALDAEFVDWAFLHDIADWDNDTVFDPLPLFDSLALKRNNGDPKLIWDLWLSLKKLPIE